MTRDRCGLIPERLRIKNYWDKTSGSGQDISQDNVLPACCSRKEAKHVNGTNKQCLLSLFDGITA